MSPADRKALIEWYRQNHRQLPWRTSRNPYRIWISEVMLQQTTTQAVIPFYERFLNRFPDLKSLATAAEEDVIEHWAGLGYYSRARNLHKAAKALDAMGGFPQTAEALLQLPGFGPYTSRAVSSLAFSEAVGVLDGNVIRVISRKRGEQSEWWKPAIRNQLQAIADGWVKNGPSEVLNQAFMELGATICIPKNPKCLVCPWMKTCKSFSIGNQNELPLPKPKRQKEIWVWQPQVHFQGKKILLVKNLDGPFLKDQWIFPGSAKKVRQKPKSFHYKHTITHHEIYVQIQHNHSKIKTAKDSSQVLWTELEKIKKISPTSLIQKALSHVMETQLQKKRPLHRSPRTRKRM